MSKQYKLDELGSVNRGKSKHRPRNDAILYGGKYPFIQTGDVKHSLFYVTSHTQTYSEKGLQQSKLWPEGTLCITIAANIADTAILTYPACFPDSIIGFIPYKDKADVKFIKYCLDTYKLQMQVMAQGTTQDNMSLEKLLSIDFSAPELPVQKKIAAILSAYDDLIENNKRRIVLLENMAEEIYREWFVRFRFPNYKNAEFEKGIPKGWEELSMDEFCEKVTDGTHDTPKPTESGKYLVTGKNIKNSQVNFDNAYLISENDHKEISRRSGLKEWDILFSNIGTIGETAVVGESPDYSVKNVIIFRPKNKNHSLFLDYTLKNPAVIEQMLLMSSGASQQFIGLGVARKFKFLSPRLDLIDSFAEKVLSLRMQVNNLIKINANLNSTKNSLLSRLISGKLTVEKLNIQFPPSMLEAEIN